MKRRTQFEVRLETGDRRLEDEEAKTKKTGSMLPMCE
jgi:hypothetical protein